MNFNINTQRCIHSKCLYISNLIILSFIEDGRIVITVEYNSFISVAIDHHIIPANIRLGLIANNKKFSKCIRLYKIKD